MLNYKGPNNGEGVAVYTNGVLGGSDTKMVERKITSGDGRALIGRCYKDSESSPGSTMVDELAFWNHTLTTKEIQDLYTMYL